MASIGEISSFSQYTGNAALGGSTSGAIEIKTEPLQQLAYYSMLSNKAEKELRLKKGEEAAKQIADLMNYDLTTAIPKDREELQKEFRGLIDYANENPNALNYDQNDPSAYLEYHKKKNEFVNKLKSAKVRTVAYQARQAAAAQDLSPEAKALRMKELDELANSTDIYTPIPTEDSYDLKVPEISAPGVMNFDVVRQDGMGVGTRSVSMINMKDVNAQALSITLGMRDKVLDETSPEFLSLSPEAQAQKRKEFERRKAGGTLIHLDMAEKYNTALEEYRNPNTGAINLPALQKNGLLTGVIQQFDNYNRYVTSVRDQIKAGVFKDKAGKALQFGMNNLDEADYQTINWQDGISPEELLKVQILSKAPADAYKTKYDETNDDIERMNAQSARINANANAKEADLKQKQWEASQSKGEETVKNGAIERARRVFEDILKVGGFEGKNGAFLTPNTIRQLNTEQLKYLGVDVTTPEGKREYNQMLLDSDNNDALEIVVSRDASGTIVDGSIKVMKDATFNNKTGKWQGKWDNTRNTNLFNTATNILNEELTKAGAKELNTYWGIDVSGTTTTNTTGGGTSQSSSSSEAYDIPSGAVVVRNKENKIIGYELDGKKYKF